MATKKRNVNPQLRGMAMTAKAAKKSLREQQVAELRQLRAKHMSDRVDARIKNRLDLQALVKRQHEAIARKREAHKEAIAQLLDGQRRALKQVKHYLRQQAEAKKKSRKNEDYSFEYERVIG